MVLDYVILTMIYLLANWFFLIIIFIKKYATLISCSDLTDKCSVILGDCITPIKTRSQISDLKEGILIVGDIQLRE